MKKSLVLFALLSLGSLCMAQSFTLADDAGPITNGMEIVQGGPSDTIQVLTWLYLTNKASVTKDVMMKKEERFMQPGALASLCWGGYCYASETTVTQFPFTIPAGETVSGCFGHFAPCGSRGLSTVRWTFFDRSNVNDSISVIATYSFFPASSGIEPSSPGMEIFSTSGGRLRVDYQLAAAAGAVITVMDLSGKIMEKRGVSGISGTELFETGNFSGGVCLVRLDAGREGSLTRKVIVSR